MRAPEDSFFGGRAPVGAVLRGVGQPRGILFWWDGQGGFSGGAFCVPRRILFLVVDRGGAPEGAFFFAGAAPAGLFFAAQVPIRYLVAGLCPAPRAHWELDRGATRPFSSPHIISLHSIMRGPRARFCALLEATIRPTAPAGVSQACTPRAQAGLRCLTPASGQGTTPPTPQTHPRLSRCARKPGDPG